MSVCMSICPTDSVAFIHPPQNILERPNQMKRNSAKIAEIEIYSKAFITNLMNHLLEV